MSEVFGVLKGALDTQWPYLLPWIERGLAEGHGEYQPDDIRALAADGLVQLWALRADDAIQGVAVSQVVDYPRLKVVQVMVAAARDGLRDEWLPWIAAIEAWARVALGASAIEVLGRPGWVRVLGDYTQSHVVMRKELT